MRLVGIDPGGRDTGVAVIEWTPLAPGVPELIASYTVHRAVDGGELAEVPRSYLVDVQSAISSAIHDYGAVGGGLEGIVKPNPHVNRRNGRSVIDPSGLLATATVVGAIMGRGWSIPIYRVRPRHNGQLFPLNRYPDPIGTRGKGHDKRRHERSAYDVAVTAGPLLASDRRLREIKLPEEARP